MRRVMRPAFTLEAIARYVPRIAETTQHLARHWQPGQRVDVVDTFRRLITDQTALMMTNRAAGADFAAVSRFFTTAVGATLGRYAAPELARPEYQAARQRVFTLLRAIVAEHAGRAPEAEADYIDLLLAARAETEQLRQERDLLAAALVPFFAGIDTVAYTCCFLLYRLLQDAALRERVAAEVEAGFAGGIPALDTLRQMTLLRAATMETLRLFPVAPPAMRTIVEAFEFAGQVVQAGQMVILATSVTHFLPELFPEPLTFDPDRFTAPRNEHRQPGAFIPFFQGPHTCLGASLGEVQVMLVLATLLHHARLALDPPGYEIELVADPILRPRGYSARVLETH
jgi:cytochrome P450